MRAFPPARDLTPKSDAAELARPSPDVGPVNTWVDGQDARRVLDLLLGAARLLRPLELGEDRVLGGGEGHRHARRQLDGLAPPELLAAERPVLPDDEVDLEGAPCLDHVELETSAERIAGAFVVDVEAGLEQAPHERVQLIRARVNDDVGVVCGAGAT